MTAPITTIGLDLVINVFQIHAADEAGNPVLKKRLRRGQLPGFFAGLEPYLVGREACGNAHYWARVLQALGHDVRLIAPKILELRITVIDVMRKCGR
jgi:transposase